MQGEVQSALSAPTGAGAIDFSSPQCRLLRNVLFGLAAIYLLYGFASLVMNRSVDAQMRWREVRYILRGIVPVEVANEFATHNFGEHNMNDPIPPGVKWQKLDPTIGHWVTLYPQWAYLTLMILFWPPYEFVGPYFALWATAAVLFVGWRTFEIFRPVGKSAALFMLAATLAINGISSSIKIGQVTIIVIAGLVGLAWLLARRRSFLSGIFFGVAMIKPTIAVPYGLILLIQRRWLSILAAGLYCAVGIAFIFLLTDTGPLAWLRLVQSDAAGYAAENFGLVRMFTWLGFQPTVAIKSLALLGGATALILVWFWRESNVLTLLAICSVVAWFWTYHQQYDTPMMLFLLLALGNSVCRHPSRAGQVMFWLVGITLWLPFRLPGIGPSIDEPYRLAIEVSRVLIWPTALAVLLWQEGVPSGNSSRYSIDAPTGQPV